MGKKGKGKAEAAEAAEAAAAARREAEERSHGRDVVLKLLAGKTAHADVARVMFEHPRWESDFVDFITELGGNQAVLAVYDELAKLEEAAPSPTDAVSTMGATSELGAAADKPQPATMPTENRRSDRLPYDGRGDWDAVEINRRMSQYDGIVGTNNDDDRCAFATILATKVFAGPGVFPSWLTAFRAEHGGSARMMNPTQSAARKVMDAIADAITAGTATFRDLAWLQEALYDYAVSSIHTGAFDTTKGVRSTNDVVSSATEKLGAGKGEATTAADVVGKAQGLAPGANLMIEWTFQRKGDDRRLHEMMISNHDGTLYLYDASAASGGNLREATVANLAPYFDPAVYASSTMKLASTLTAKPTATAD